MEEKRNNNNDMKGRARKFQIYLFTLLAVIFLGVMFLNLADLSKMQGVEPTSTHSNKVEAVKVEKGLAEGYLPLTDEEKYVQARGVALTREYQMKVDTTLFQNRSKGVQYYIEGLYKHYKLPELLVTRPGADTVRNQYNINTRNCGKVYSVRVRNYYTGFMEGKSTVDIKSSTGSDRPDEGQEKVFDKEYTPAANQLDTAMQKFEADVHPCHIKWSRESRVYNIPFNISLTKCYELLDLFPGAKSTAGHENSDLTKGDAVYESWVWELEHTGKTKNGTKFKSAFTLQYPTYEEAINGNTIPTQRRGEWSMRTWSSDNGKGQWLESEILYFDAAYINTLLYFGSPDLPCASASPAIPRKFPLPHN